MKKVTFKLILCIVLTMSVTLIVGFSTPVTVTKANKKSEVKHPKVEIIMKNGGTMVFELYPEYAPQTVENFIKLASSNFYNGLTFHRIAKNFMVQGGDPLGTGMGGSSETIKGEFSSNGFTKNTLSHTKGVISMARTDKPNTASSQFFIVDGDAKFLDGNYAAFGKLILGEKTLDAIAATPVDIDPNSREKTKPKKEVIIKKMIVLSNTK